MTDAAIARLQGSRAFLRLVETEDYPNLRRLELGGEIGIRWRHAGAHVRPEDYGADLAGNSLVCFVYESLSGPKSMGLIVGYGAEFRNGFAYCGMARLQGSGSTVSDSLVAADALVLALDYMFQAWNFRKVLFEVAEYNHSQFASFTALLSAEARFQRHIFLGDKWWDVYVFALWRDEWPSVRRRLVRAS